MQILDVSCPSCTEVFRNLDDVYITGCGHLFHFVCMADWKKRSTSCPHCHQYNPTCHKLYLSIDESNNISLQLAQLKQKLETCNETINELQAQNEKLQDQYTAADNEKRALEAKIRQLNENREYFKQLQGPNSDPLELLKDGVEQLSIKNESKTKEPGIKIVENKSLKSTQDINQIILSDEVLNEKINILEKKLENLSMDLEKELNNSIRKIKLDTLNYIKNSSAVDKNKQITKKPNKQKENDDKQNRKNQTKRK